MVFNNLFFFFFIIDAFNDAVLNKELILLSSMNLTTIRMGIKQKNNDGIYIIWCKMHHLFLVRNSDLNIVHYSISLL
jgi:hypothetical protein